MDQIVKEADIFLSNKIYDTSYKNINVKKELLLSKYNKLNCKSCVDVKEKNSQVIV